MNETVSLLLSVCAVLAVVVGLLAVGAFLVLRFLARRTRGLPVGAFGALGSAFRSESAADVDAPVSGKHHRVNLRDLAASVDFDAAVARHANDETPPPDPNDSPAPGPNIHIQNTQSPINGRIMRDGRYRRVTGGTPGREKNQDFRRVGDSPPLPDFDTPQEPPLRRRRRGDRSAKEDEIFGGMLDEDGDGEVDF